MGEENQLLKHYASPDASIKGVAVRYGVYTIFLASALASLPYCARKFGTDIFRENSLIENIQFGILAIVAISFFIAAIKIREHRAVYTVMAHLSVFAAMRELDSYLDRQIEWHGWKTPAALTFLSLVIFIVMQRKKLAGQIRWFINKRSFAIIWVALIIVTVIAQLVGHGRTLRALMGDEQYEQVTYYKRIIEEFIETVGYYMLLVGSLELFIEDLRKKARPLKAEEKELPAEVDKT